MEFCKSSKERCIFIALAAIFVVAATFLFAPRPNALPPEMQPETKTTTLRKADSPVSGAAMQVSHKPGSAYGKFAAHGKVKLIMFEQWGCEYCEQWHEDVGGVYGKTEEGKFAPLELADYRTARSKYHISGVVFTPTFVLIEDGKEVGRITGYHSEDFFWEFLDDIMNKAGYTSPSASPSPASGKDPKTGGIGGAISDQAG